MARAAHQPAKKKGLATAACVLLLVGGAGIVLTFGLSNIAANGQTAEPATFDGPQRAPGDTSPGDTFPVPAAESEPASPSPIVAPIVDAEEVVGQIDDNSQEEMLLDELGLDPTGDRRAATGDAATGGFLTVFTDASGMSWADETHPESGEVVASLGSEESPVRLDAPLTQDDLMSESILVGIIDTSISFSTETGTTATQTIDLTDLRANDPGALEAWAQGVGLVPANLGLVPADTAVVTMLIGDDGVLTGFEIRVESSDQTVSYERTSTAS